MKIHNILKEMSHSDAVSTENALDMLFADIGLDVEFSKHFLNRTLDDGQKGRNDYHAHSKSREKDITKEEIINVFSELKKHYGKKLYDARNDANEFVGVRKDATTHLNIPFSIDYDKVYNKMHKLTAITVMRKDNFHVTNGTTLAVNSK